MPRVCVWRARVCACLLLCVWGALGALGARADHRDHDFHFIDDKAQLLDTPPDLQDPLSALCAGVQCGAGSRCVVSARGGRSAASCGPLAAAAAAAAIGGADGSHNERRRARDDEVYYEWSENDINKDKHKEKCVSCGPVAAPPGVGLVCGSDSRTYSSLCRLDLRNCLRRAPEARPPVTVRCSGACPCTRPPVAASCSARSLADRLLDWFSVVMAAEGGSPPPAAGFPRECKPEVRWMFSHLDSDGDGVLSADNLYALSHDDREACLRPFLSRCGRATGARGKATRAGLGLGQPRTGPGQPRTGPGQPRAPPAGLTRAAWCGCLRGAARPCRALARAHPRPAPGSYVPSCDSAGFYRPRQCHPALGVCWCVSPHGVERRGSRGAGRVRCGGAGGVGGQGGDTPAAARGDDEDGDDGEGEGEAGSGDTPILD